MERRHVQKRRSNSSLLHLRHPLADVVAVGVSLLAKGNGRIAPKVLIEEARTTQPHPVRAVERPVCIDQELVKHLPVVGHRHFASNNQDRANSRLEVMLQPRHLIHHFVYRYFSYLGPRLPALVEVTAGQEAGDGVPCEVVNPAFHFKLRHDRVDVRVPRAALLPSQYQARIVVPVNLPK